MNAEMMTITIQNDKTVRQVQQEFSELFPFLKIEFFTRPHGKGKGTEKKFIQEKDVPLREMRHAGLDGVIRISSGMSVAELEQLFESNYGLHVQVFRRSGKLWLETTATDNWTLNYQNEQGKELSQGSLSDDREEIDYHEQE